MKHDLPIGFTVTSQLLPYVEKQPDTRWFTCGDMVMETGLDRHAVSSALGSWARKGWLMADDTKQPTIYSVCDRDKRPGIKHHRWTEPALPRGRSTVEDFYANPLHRDPVGVDLDDPAEIRDASPEHDLMDTIRRAIERYVLDVKPAKELTDYTSDELIEELYRRRHVEAQNSPRQVGSTERPNTV